MPTGPRIRANNHFGTITDNPLLIGALTFNSSRLGDFPAVSSAHAVVTLDPLRLFGDSEIVVITAHTALATVATITRGVYGTTAREHPQGTTWIHAPIDEDVIEVLTSGTLPADPYEGQFVFETDTNKLVGYGGTDWAPRDAGGQLGYAQAVANQGSITTIVDLTSLTTTFTVGTGRRVKITGECNVQSNNAGSRIDLAITDGANTIVQLRSLDVASVNTNSVLHAEVVLSLSAGSNTYKLRMQDGAAAGTVTMAATATTPAFILVEDIGAA